MKLVRLSFRLSSQGIYLEPRARDIGGFQIIEQSRLESAHDNMEKTGKR